MPSLHKPHKACGLSFFSFSDSKKNLISAKVNPFLADGAHFGRITAPFIVGYMKHTAFYEIHKKAGAKLIPFAGFEMPVNYSKGIIAEHLAVRRAVGMFDVSHMGEVEIRGANALDFVQYITTNDASKLSPGKAQYSALCYDNGGVVDDLLVYHCGDYYMLVINASNIDKDVDWMNQHRARFADVELRNVSDEIHLLAIQGPQSLQTLQKLTTATLGDIAYYSFVQADLASIPMIISRTGYTGELGFELYFRANPSTAESVWNFIMDAGAEFGIEPVGLGARDTLRLEKGYCLYGNDISPDTHPLEAGLGWITKLGKPDFAGKTALMSAKETGITRKLVGLRMVEEKVIPRQNYPIHHNGEPVGAITSGTLSPVLNRGIALGYVPTALSAPGTQLFVAIRGKESPAEVVTLPFV